MLTKIIKGHSFYYQASDDAVISALDQNILFGDEVWTLLKRYIVDDNAAVVDCGAHLGTFAFAPAIEEGRRTILIEAAEANFECLTHTFADCPNVSLHHAILLDGQYSCGFSKKYGPYGSVSKIGEGDRKSTTLDALLSTLEVPIGALKVDVEGNELEVLRGAALTLATGKPPIVLEVNGPCLALKGKKPRQVFELLDALNYSYFLPNGDDKLVSIDKDSLFPFAVRDILALHNAQLHLYLPSTTFVRCLRSSVLHDMLLESVGASDERAKAYLQGVLSESLDRKDRD